LGIGDEPGHPEVQLRPPLQELLAEGEGNTESLQVKSIGKPDALNAPVRFEVAGTGNQFMDWLLRYSQRKRRETDRPSLRVWRQFSTLPSSRGGVRRKRGANTRADEQEPDEEAYGAGRASQQSGSPYPSRALVVNPAIARGKRSNLSREICCVSPNRD
jgi:hypothetical protein